MGRGQVVSNESDTQLRSIDSGTLTPMVRRALGSDRAEVASWDVQQIHASATRARIFRISGSARDRGEMVPWSLVLKAIPPQSDRNEPSGSHYWKREALLYQSGLLDDLPGGLAAPPCLGVAEQPGGEFRIWMEDVKDDVGPTWPLEHYGVVARHLGQFNGAYLMGRPMPSDPWLSRGWLRQAVARATSGIAQLRGSLDHPLVRRVYPPVAAEALFRLCEERQVFLATLDHLPQTFCHRDAFRRDLFARRSADGGWHTVAIDWAFSGPGAIREELVPLVMATVGFFEVGADKLGELEAIVFESYLGGLREAGWRGDESVARLGYVASAALLTASHAPGDISMLSDESLHAQWERVMGHSMEQVADQWAGLGLLLLGWEEEARELMGSM